MDEAGWPKCLPQMKVIDDLLRCGICFDYYNIAMIIPQCSHNYCSLCIRKFLSYKTQCPTCCVAAVEPDLRNNRVLDELVKNFNSARQHLFQFVLDSPPLSPLTLRGSNSSGKLLSARSAGCSRIKQENVSMDNFFVKTKTSKSKRAESCAIGDQEVIQMEAPARAIETDRGERQEATSSGSPSTTASPRRASTPGMKDVPKVECPVCGVGIPQQFINKHLDSCLTSDEKKESLRSSAHKRKPMAKVVYNLLSDRDLRKKLKDAGLSSQGPKQQLIKRHLEFVHMYNAQCDSLNPKSAAEIVKEIEHNEKSRAQLQTKPGENSLTFTKDQSEQEIEGIHSDYRQKHKNEFQLLVDQVKNRWRKSVKKDITVEEDQSKLPAGLEGDVGKQCPEQISAVDLSPDASIVNQSGANLSEDAVNLNDGGASPSADAVADNEGGANLSPYFIMNERRADRSPDVITNEVGADELPLRETPVRSESPSFPLSPQSRASSSSDILRDLEEVKSDESSDFNLPEAKVVKRKSKSPRPQEGGRASSRSKRSRK